MPNIANNIFNRKLLATVIKNFDFSKIKDLQQKKDILLRWEKTIELNVLKNVGEIALDGTFINNIFSEVLGYKNITQNNNEWNLNYKQKTKQDATRADGALKKGIRISIFNYYPVSLFGELLCYCFLGRDTESSLKSK